MNIHPKVYWPAVVGMVCIAGSWALHQFYQIEVPSYVATAVSTGLMGLAGYSAPAISNGVNPNV